MGSPKQIGGDADWTAIAAGNNHSLALKTNGELYAWGNNSSGQVGDGTTTQRNSPVRVGSDSDWAEVSAGYELTVAVKSDGSMWGWGGNGDGEVGDHTTSDRVSSRFEYTSMKVPTELPITRTARQRARSRATRRLTGPVKRSLWPEIPAIFPAQETLSSVGTAPAMAEVPGTSAATHS